MADAIVKHCIVCDEDGHTYEVHFGLFGPEPRIYPGMPAPIQLLQEKSHG